jgi:hypothetical protein
VDTVGESAQLRDSRVPDVREAPRPEASVILNSFAACLVAYALLVLAFYAPQAAGVIGLSMIVMVAAVKAPSRWWRS